MKVFLYRIIEDEKFQLRDVTIHRHAEIPFAPYPGLTILGDQFEVQVWKVWFDTDDGRVGCEIEHIKTDRQAECVKEYVALGWTEGWPNKEA